MRLIKALTAVLFVTLLCISNTSALQPIEGEVFGISPITNEVSFYKNVDDSGTDRGLTMQIISINGFKAGTDFNFEFTGDFNWDMSYESYDYYIELSLVKPVLKNVSLNYQRVIAKFEDESINQFGIRFSF